MSKRPKMTRAVRTARGLFGSLAVTLLAATSHGLAGGTITPVAILATSVLALPLTVLLAGKIGSLWRLSVGVVCAQFAYHFSFSGLGAVSLQASTEATLAASPHAAHLGLLSPIAMARGTSADVATEGSTLVVMWGAHAIAAVATIALLHRGEQAALALVRVLHSRLPRVPSQAVRLPEVQPLRAPAFSPVASKQQIFLSAISHRGPPGITHVTA